MSHAMNSSPTGDGSNLFVASLPPGTNDERLRQLFEPFGQIVSAKVMIDLRTKTLRSHGFVRYTAPHEASAAINAMHRRKIDDASPPLHVALSTHNDNDRSAECDVVYVRNLPDGVSVEQLRQAFSRFGTIVDVTLPSNSSAGHQGVGFVRYATIDEARAAVTQAHNSAPFGGNRALQVRFKESKQMSLRRGVTKGRSSNAGSPSQSNATTPFHSNVASPNDPGLTGMGAMHTPHNMSLSGHNISPQMHAVNFGGGSSQVQPMVILPMHTGSPTQQNIAPMQGSPMQGSPIGQLGSHPGTGSPTGQPLQPMLRVNAPPQGSVSPNGQPLLSMTSHPGTGSPAGQPLQPASYSPGNMSLPAGPAGSSTTMPTFSLAASGAVSSPAPQQRPFPGANDLFLANYYSEEWALEQLQPWQPARVQRANNTMVVRLADENRHFAAAQSLNGRVHPATGAPLTVALVA